VTPQQWIFALAVLSGGSGMWLVLPRGTRRGRALGVVLALVGLGLLVSQVPRVGGWLAGGMFYVLAATTVFSAAATVSLRNPIYSAIWFGMTLLGTAGLFLYQGAQFLAVATIVVYAGAILVTFLFVLMLAEPAGRAVYDRLAWEGAISAISGAVLVGVLTITITTVLAGGPQPRFAPAGAEALQAGVLQPDHVAALGRQMYGPYLIAVEVGGTLLLAALVGAAAIVARRQPEDAEPENETKED